MFFRREVASGFGHVLGDTVDGFIQLSILQHWHNVLRGLERWDTTAYFYPWPDTLAYNDGYLLPGLVYALARTCALDPFAAEMTAWIVLHAIGFAAFLRFASDALGLGFPYAVLGAALVTIASNLYLQSGHGQLLAFSLTPLVGWLLWRAGRHLADGRSVAACLWGLAAAGLFGGLLLTAFYVAWFTAVLTALVALAAIPFIRVRPRPGVVSVWPLLATGAAFLVAAIPFALVYLPKVRETGVHGFGEVMLYSPSLPDLVHLGRGNLLFGPLDGWVTDHLRPGFPDAGEHAIGFGPIQLALALGGGVVTWRQRRQFPLRIALALATCAALALAVHVGRHTLWYGVFRIVPGAAVVRVVTRIALVLTFPIVALAMVALERLGRPLLVVPLAVLLIAENVTSQQPALLDRRAELAKLAAIPPAPPSCRAFFVSGDVPSHLVGPSLDDDYPHNTDAMLIASLRALPTVNGISTFDPPDWVFTRPTTASYLRRVSNYLRRHDLQHGICGLDLGDLRWQEGPPDLPPLPPLALGVDHVLRGPAMDDYLDLGWEGPNPVGRWTVGPLATLSLALPAGARDHDLAIDLDGLPIVWNGRKTSPIVLSVNGTAVTTWHPVVGHQHLRAVIPARLLGPAPAELSLRIVRPRSPSELGQSPDSRALGFFVISLRLDPMPSGS